LSDSFREAAWMCLMCGYLMDSASHPTKLGAVPKEDDNSLCLNCGTVYVRHNGKWALMTRAEREALSTDQRAEIAGLESVRRVAIDKDLTKGRGGRA
jgi:hypothetical protein